VGAFNTVAGVHAVCPACAAEVDVDVQFKYAETWQQPL
jgi:hypothetical protein